MAKILVLGNEKGGTGKSTTAMHVIVALLRQGNKVGSIDLDTRQASLSRYIDNRKEFIASTGKDIPLPTHTKIHASEIDIKSEAEKDERERFEAALNKLKETQDYIVIDCPGSDRYLSHLAHSHADTLITPMNDSFIDLDLLAHIDGENLKMEQPSCYALMVWEQRKVRAMQKRPPIDWIVMRNRLSSLDARNKRDITQVLDQLSKRLSFRLAPGFGERVVFKELFLQGLTLSDFKEANANMALTMSHVAARQEVRQLLSHLGIQEQP